MDTQYIDLAHIGTIPSQVHITYTMSPHLTIRLQFFQDRGQNKKHFTNGKIPTYVYTLNKIQSQWNQQQTESTMIQQERCLSEGA